MPKWPGLDLRDSVTQSWLKWRYWLCLRDLMIESSPNRPLDPIVIVSVAWINQYCNLQDPHTTHTHTNVQKSLFQDGSYCILRDIFSSIRRYDPYVIVIAKNFLAWHFSCLKGNIPVPGHPWKTFRVTASKSGRQVENGLPDQAGSQAYTQWPSPKLNPFQLSL